MFFLDTSIPQAAFHKDTLGSSFKPLKRDEEQLSAI